MKIKSMVKNIWLLICISSLFFCSLSIAATIKVDLSSAKVALGDTITISYTLDSNANAITPNFAPLEKDFRILSTNYGNAINMLNGVTTTKTYWRVTVEPQKSGELIIPAIDFGDAKSTAQKLLVQKTIENTHDNNQDAPVFIEANVSTTTPYVQSQVIYTFKLFYQAQIENPLVEIPPIKNATLVQLDQGNHYQTVIKGRPYLVIEKNFALFPQKPGQISIGATHFRALSYVDPSTLNNPFDMPSPKIVNLATKAYTLKVKDIPNHLQGSVWLPANALSLTEEWSSKPGEWQAGTPVTRIITIKADGLRADQIPDLVIEKQSGVDMYIDPPKRSNILQSNSVIGSWEQKITYIPGTTQTISLPAIKLAWWNVQTNTEVLAQLDAVRLQVTGMAVQPSSAPPKITISPAPKTLSETAPLTQITSKNNSFYRSVWFWIALISLKLWLATLFYLWYKKSGKDFKKIFFNRRLDTTIKLREKDFKQACQQGNAKSAQEFLLSWAKTQTQNSIVNLEKLREIVNDTSFKAALDDLEQAIYAKQPLTWNGNTLLKAYQKIKKQRSYFNFRLFKKTTAASLPPLHP